MTAPRVLLLVEDDAVSGAIRFALEVEEIEVVVFANLAELQREAAGTESCVVIDRGSDGREALALLKHLRSQEIAAPAVVLASTPTRRLSAAVKALNATVIEKPLLRDELVATIRGFSRDGRELH